MVRTGKMRNLGPALQLTWQYGVLAMTTATAGTKPCKKSINILPSNVPAL